MRRFISDKGSFVLPAITGFVLISAMFFYSPVSARPIVGGVVGDGKVCISRHDTATVFAI